jgi:hypothetical protein
MTRIERAVKIVSDLYEFYRRIPKIRAAPEEERKPGRAQPPKGSGSETAESGGNR